MSLSPLNTAISETTSVLLVLSLVSCLSAGIAREQVAWSIAVWSTGCMTMFAIDLIKLKRQRRQISEQHRQACERILATEQKNAEAKNSS